MMDTLLCRSFVSIKRYLHKYVLGKAIQDRLHLAKRLEVYPNKELWTKDMKKESFKIQSKHVNQK